MPINVLEFLEHSAAVYPDKPAFADEHNSYTFAQTLHIAKAVGSRLARTVQPGNPVAVFMERCALAPACFWGAVYAGCFYVPLDAQLPEHRLNLILQTIQAPALLVDAKNAAMAQKLRFNGELVRVEEAAEAAVDERTLQIIRDSTIDTQPLYAIFTSGSTGVPKGVLISHKSVLGFIEQFTETFGISADDVIGNQAPFDFDVSVKDLYATLKCGATLCIIPRQYFSMPARLMAFLSQHRVTTIIWAVSALCVAASLKAFDVQTPLYLNKVLFSGEVMPIKHLNTWREHLPEALFVNLYGPTEITCNCSYYIVERNQPLTGSLPIGQPFRNTRILVLNKHNEPVSEGAIGELCVLGSGLALGYYNNPEQTARAFVQNPLNPHYPERMYRTGDLARYNERGELLFLGRSDYQIKHMGHRIELGEIETAVNALEGVRSCCCLYDENNQFIYLLHESEGLSEKDILLALRQTLPKYMLPQRIIALEHMPLNKNGKIDRIRLREEYVPGKSS
ncbi:MAG: amino acid adenylation domain-containing protein [Chloroflexi bacterium]|nr:amino acid adenylation domain-containing protein [Chloroflexota bacterium]